jgi:hypothetical protein
MMKITHTAAARKSGNINRKPWRSITEKRDFRILKIRIFTLYIWQVSSSTAVQEKKLTIKPADRYAYFRTKYKKEFLTLMVM